MVAIIGNKGCGKERACRPPWRWLAIPRNATTFRSSTNRSLARKKLSPRTSRSSFAGKTARRSSTICRKTLTPTSQESVTYIPQTYLETVCTETSVDEGSAFQHELHKVIFSHITEAQRLGRDTLEELITYKTEEIQTELARHKAELSQNNANISALEQKATEGFRRQIEEAAAEKKKKELQAHGARRRGRRLPSRKTLATSKRRRTIRSVEIWRPRMLRSNRCKSRSRTQKGALKWWPSKQLWPSSWKLNSPISRRT